MKTIYSEAHPGKVVLAEKELGHPGPGEVLIKAKYSTMSPGTECGLLHEAIVPLPTNIGYAMAGEVIEVGEGVEEFKVGDHVVSTIEHAQYIITSELNCTLCPKGVDLKQAAFWNLGHTGMYAIRRSQIQMGEACIVMGEGFVGAVTAQLARIAGACPVILTGHHDEKLEASRQMGVDYTVNTKTDPEGLEKLLAQLGLLESGVPVIFEATGNRAALLQACQLAQAVRTLDDYSVKGLVHVAEGVVDMRQHCAVGQGHILVPTRDIGCHYGSVILVFTTSPHWQHQCQQTS